MTALPNQAARGGRHLQDRVTSAITLAFFDELAEVGYGRLSVDAIARRAGAGKAAIYRRWSSKQEMAITLLSSSAVSAVAIADTGSFREDIRAFLRDAAATLGQPQVRLAVPDVLAESARNPALRSALHEQVEAPRRTLARPLIERAIERGELPPGCDVVKALDLMAAPVYWRLIVLQGSLTDVDIDALTDATVAGIAALPARPER